MLLEPDNTKEGVIIEGAEKVGCTSLLYRLYDEYHERGYVPLLLRGPEIKSATDKEIDRLIRSAVIVQYGNAAVPLFAQLPTSKKLLLFDDFDDGPIRAEAARRAVLNNLRKRFGHVVVVVGELFEVRELLDGLGSVGLGTLKHYRLQPLGFVLRARLVRRWFQQGNDGTLDEAALLERCDGAERVMHSVMAKNIIPSMPLYLLTLLQSVEGGRSGDFRESALGFYYQFLLTEAFEGAGVQKEKFGELFEYCTVMAWFFFKSGRHTLDEHDLREFNGNFTRERHTVDFSERMEVLVRSKILLKRGNEYSFRYPYAYYFLKGRYLSQELAKNEIRDYVKHCCEHLYVRENANTILFLAHHTSDEFILDTIEETLRSLFKKEEPITFTGDTKIVEALIESAPETGILGRAARVASRKGKPCQG